MYTKVSDFCLCWGLTTRQPLWVILCRLPEKGRKEIEEIVEEIKERNREERGTLVGHFVLSPGEREKSDRRDSRGDERERQGRKRNRNESKETE